MKTRLLAAAALLLALSACGSPGPNDDPSDGSTTSSESRTTGSASLGSKEADALVGAMATGVVTLWARPDIPVAQWAAELRPRLSTVAVSTLSFIDPTTLEPAELSGDPRLVAASKARASVVVPTTAGEYKVTLGRAPGGSAWLVDSVVSP